MLDKELRLFSEDKLFKFMKGRFLFSCLLISFFSEMKLMGWNDR